MKDAQQLAAIKRLIGAWTGHTVRCLRLARRLSVRQFAEHLGVSDRMVSKWEARGHDIRPGPVNQSALDVSLVRCTPDERERFVLLQGLPGKPEAVPGVCPTCQQVTTRGTRRPLTGPSDPRHGKASTYSYHGCRCARCKKAWRDDHNARRAAQVPPPPDDPRHGTLNCYRNLSCRCGPCYRAGKLGRARYAAPRKALT